jgi:hypothetical protein
VHLAETTCLWYGSFHTRTVRVILLRDDTTDTGYDLALVTTDLTNSPAELITRYTMRWSIEVTFAEARDLLGAGQAHNRTRHAVERTVPSTLYCYTITVAWYALHGHQPSDVAEHRERAPWYTTKTDPSLADMVAKLRPPRSLRARHGSMAARDQVAVPPQHGVRTHQQPQPAQHLQREPVQQRRQKRPIDWAEPHLLLTELTLQHRDLMAQGKDLHILLPITHRHQAQHRERVRHTQVSQSQQHGRSAREHRLELPRSTSTNPAPHSHRGG